MCICAQHFVTEKVLKLPIAHRQTAYVSPFGLDPAITNDNMNASISRVKVQLFLLVGQVKLPSHHRIFSVLFLRFLKA